MALKTSGGEGLPRKNGGERILFRCSSELFRFDLGQLAEKEVTVGSCKCLKLFDKEQI